MTDEERRIISQFVERISGAAAPAPTASPWGGGSVPSTQARPSLPPVDREADALIADLFSRYPEARYRITQTAFVQEAALVEAQNRIRQLEWEVENAHGQAQAAAQPQRGGLFGGMFGGGGGARPMPPTRPQPQPVYPPNYNPGMLQPQRGGSGFLGTALTTAAGVAGGMVLGNMLMGAFSGHHGAAGGRGLRPRRRRRRFRPGSGADRLPLDRPRRRPRPTRASARAGAMRAARKAPGPVATRRRPDATGGGYDTADYDTGTDDARRRL